jgi:hypothetical protein
MESQTIIETVTVEEAMQAMSEALRSFADDLTDILDALVHDECREERKLEDGMSDLDEQLAAVKQWLEVNDSFESRLSLLGEVVERYRGGSHPIDKLRRDIERLLHKDYGRLRLSSEALCGRDKAARSSPS